VIIHLKIEQEPMMSNQHLKNTTNSVHSYVPEIRTYLASMVLFCSEEDINNVSEGRTTLTSFWEKNANFALLYKTEVPVWGLCIMSGTIKAGG
jgi:hypothetical protein